MRLGHSRPAGTEWKMRLHSWDHDVPPLLGDLVFEWPETLYRGFRVVGVEETSVPTTFRLVLERLTWQDYLDAAATGRSWSFVRDKR